MRTNAAKFVLLALLGLVATGFLGAVAAGLVGHADITAGLVAPRMPGFALWATVAGLRQLTDVEVDRLEATPTKVEAYTSRRLHRRTLHMGAIALPVGPLALRYRVYALVRDDQLACAYFTRRGGALLALEQPIARDASEAL